MSTSEQEALDAVMEARRAAYIRNRHDASSHARGPGCHCREAGRRPNFGTGCHEPGTCAICDAWRDSPAGRAEAAYWSSREQGDEPD